MLHSPTRTEGIRERVGIYRLPRLRKGFRDQEILTPYYPPSPCFMGPRKRSKPNPKAETEPVSREGPELQIKDSSKSVVGDSVPSNTPENVESAHFTVNETNTVSAGDGPLVQDETDLCLDTAEQNMVRWDMATWEQGQSGHPGSQRELFSSRWGRI